MSWIPAFEIGLWNAWWFMGVYLLQWLAVVLTGPRLSQRTGAPADIESTGTQRKNSVAATVTWIIATLYSVFLPFYTGTAWFYVGLASFAIGLAILIAGTISFVKAPADGPITRYMFRYTRHPMYLSMLFVYTGVCLTTASWLFFLITVTTFFLQRQTAIFEEIYCLKKYGDAYRSYLDTTPRWIGIPKTG